MSIMRRHARVQCPRCKQIWDVPWGQDGVECNCHKWCSEGDKETDCSWQEYNYTGSLGWPHGAHTNRENEGDDLLHRVGYCSTHKKYTYKVPLFLEVNWKEWTRKGFRAKEKFRTALKKA